MSLIRNYFLFEKSVRWVMPVFLCFKLKNSATCHITHTKRGKHSKYIWLAFALVVAVVVVVVGRLKFSPFLVNDFFSWQLEKKTIFLRFFHSLSHFFLPSLSFPFSLFISLSFLFLFSPLYLKRLSLITIL
jgi:hypothetical protein